jgi:hypothetical protein
MIAMPRRSVTRFFIPLIDVLLLLFCVFLLLPMMNEEELAQNAEVAGDLTETADALEKELERRGAELASFEDLRPQLLELAALRAEVERLRKERKPAAQRMVFKILDIDRDDGSLSYYDSLRPNAAKLRITDEMAAHALIKQHQDEADGRELYYYFLYPRPESGFPTRQQAQNYGKWFINAANSLKRREALP